MSKSDYLQALDDVEEIGVLINQACSIPVANPNYKEEFLVICYDKFKELKKKQ